MPEMRRPVSPRCLCLVVNGGVIAQWFSNWRGDQRAVLTGQLCCPPYCLARRSDRSVATNTCRGGP